MRGDGRAELTGYDLASISCLGCIYMKPDQAVEIAAGGVFCSSVSYFIPILSKTGLSFSGTVLSCTRDRSRVRI